MKKRQRILAVLLAGSMVMTAGCGSRKGLTEEPAPADRGEETETAGGQDGPENPESSENGEGSEGVPQIRFVQKTADDYDENSGQWLLHVEYQMAEATGGSDEVEQAVLEWSESQADEIEGLRKSYALAAAEDGASAESFDYYRSSITQQLEISRVDSRVISLIERNSEYTGGAHGSYGSDGVTFDAKSGEILELSDLLTDTDGFQEKAEEFILGRLSEREAEGLFPDYENTIRQMWKNDPDWYLDAAGITFSFDPYLLGPWAMGEVMVTVPYDELRDCMAEAYMPERLVSLSAAMAARVPEGESVRLYASPLDSQPVTLRVWLDDGEEEYGPVRIEMDGVQAETESFVRIGDIFLMCPQDGRTFLVFDADYASDDFVTFVFELKDRLLVECDRKEGLRIGAVNTDSLTGWMHLDVLGSYSGRMDYTLGADGQLEALGDWYEIPVSDVSWRELNVIRELPVRIGEEETTLPAGSRICITAADGAGNVRFRESSTGVEGEISCEREEDGWTLTINGISENEYFEAIPYAG